MLWRDRISARAVITITTALCFTLPFLVFHPGVFGGRADFLLDAVWHRPDIFDVTPPSPPPDSYDWHTHSYYKPVHDKNASDKSIAELCNAFPTDLLDYVQPVLKTGHALLQQRLIPQLQSASACLTNLIIYSDLEEEFEGRQVIDVIADIPPHLPHWANKSKKKLDQLAPHTALQEYQANGTLDIVDTSHLAGWKTDKFKFLPGISRTWMMRPEKHWYFFFEDDTYVNWDNVFRLLANFDPDRPWYFGSPTGGRKPTDKPVTWFAYGGTGYIISRGAMRKLVKDDYTDDGEYLGSKLTERWWNPETLEDCCGDSILGWVLWNEGVPLAGLWPMMGPTRPTRVGFSNRQWCQPILTMHKPSAESLIGLWRWEFEQRRDDRPLLYRDMAISYFNFSSLTTRQDWDNAGRGTYRAPDTSSSYTHDPHASFDACKTACEAVPKCMQYTYHTRTCRMEDQFRFGNARTPELGKEASQAEKETDWEEEDLRFHSGWVTNRIQKWMDERPCEKVHWVRPSIDRIF